MLKPMRILAILSLIVTSTACGWIGAPMSPTATPDPSIVGAEEYAVYSVLVKGYAVRSHTASRCCTREGCMPGVTSEMISDRDAKTEDSPLDSARFDVQVVLVGPEVMPVSFEDWVAFRRDYPGARGIANFSRVGFNAKKDRAVVYAGYYRGSTNAEGLCIVLAKQNGRWSVEDRKMVWIS